MVTDERIDALMRYHLNVRGGNQFIEDEERCGHGDLAGAIEEAIVSARNMLADRVREGRPLGHRVLEIRDEAGELLKVLPFESALPEL